MTDQQKEKLKERIRSGQTIDMLCWEFKMNKKNISSFAKEHSLVLRTGDYLRYASKLSSRMK